MTMPVYASGMHIDDNGNLVIDADEMDAAGVRELELIEGVPESERRRRLLEISDERANRLSAQITELEARAEAAERELAEAQKAIEAHVELYRDASVRAERQTRRADSYARTAQACLRDAGPALVQERERAEKAEADAGRLRDALVRIIKRTQGCEPVLATDVRLMAEAALSPAEQADDVKGVKG